MLIKPTAVYSASPLLHSTRMSDSCRETSGSDDCRATEKSHTEGEMRVWSGFGTIQQTVRKRQAVKHPHSLAEVGECLYKCLRWAVKFIRNIYHIDKDVSYRLTETEEVERVIIWMKSVPKGTEKDNGWEDSDWLKHTVLWIPEAEKRQILLI